MFKKLVKNKLRAFKKATEKIELLKIKHRDYIRENYGQNIDEKFIGINVFDLAKFIFESDEYYEYVKYADLAKMYNTKISSIKTAIAVPVIIIAILLIIFIRPIWIPILCVIVLAMLLIWILRKLKSGETYSSFYQRTLVSFLSSVYPNIVFSTQSLYNIPNSEIVSIVGRHFDEKRVLHPMLFKGVLTEGDIADLELIDITEVKDKDGNTREIRTKVFDGLYIKIGVKTPFKLLKGNTIRIRADENIISHLAEDTFKSVYENEKELSFNAEEMNKSFDARISGYKGFSSVDDALIVAKKIITPSFESHLLFLRERYNSFNMNISDNGLYFSVQMARSLLQKAKHKELFDFKTTYREANENFRMLTGNLLGDGDFAYYNIFPFLERLYLVNYLTYLYLSYIDFENYYDINNNEISKYETEMRNIYNMSQNDFMKLYADKIEKITKETKKFALVFEKEER